MAKAVKIKQIKAANQAIADVGTQFQIEIEGVPTRFKTTLVGMDPDKCLLVKAPKITGDDKSDKELAVGDNVIVRYLYNGAVLGFQSKLIDSIKLFCRFPGITGEYEIVCKIKNITQDSQKKVLGIQYIEFVDLETKSIVREYIASAKSHI
jgi:flagellar protein YcgR